MRLFGGACDKLMLNACEFGGKFCKLKLKELTLDVFIRDKV